MLTRNIITAALVLAGSAVTSAGTIPHDQTAVVPVIVAADGSPATNATQAAPQAAPANEECMKAQQEVTNQMAKATQAVTKIEDQHVKNAAMAGLHKAKVGVIVIVIVIVNGQAVRTGGRNDVGDGLSMAYEALAGAKGNDEAIPQAQQSLKKAMEAGQEVVAMC